MLRGRTIGRVGAAIATVVMLLPAAGPAQAGHGREALNNAAEPGDAWFQVWPLHAPGKCMAVHNNNVRNNSPVHLWDCENTNPAMEWRPATWNGRPVIINRVSGENGARMCLDVPAPGQGAQLIVHECHGNSNQLWRMEYSSVHRYLIVVNLAYNMLLDAAYSGTGNGTPVQVWPHVSQPNQSWRFFD